jgi:6-phosphogluconate dehydrogenase (decarboxylating)
MKKVTKGSHCNYKKSFESKSESVRKLQDTTRRCRDTEDTKDIMSTYSAFLKGHLENFSLIFQDTTRRCRDLKKKGILYVGSGVSGGEEGARYGPSLMPGGNPEAWPHIKDIFQVKSFCII